MIIHDDLWWWLVPVFLLFLNRTKYWEAGSRPLPYPRQCFSIVLRLSLEDFRTNLRGKPEILTCPPPCYCALSLFFFKATTFWWWLLIMIAFVWLLQLQKCCGARTNQHVYWKSFVVVVCSARKARHVCQMFFVTQAKRHTFVTGPLVLVALGFYWFSFLFTAAGVLLQCATKLQVTVWRHYLVVKEEEEV